MGDFFDVHPKPNSLKQLLRHPYGVVARARSDNCSRGPILYSKDQMPAAFVRQRDAVLLELFLIVLIFRFFKLETLVLRR